MFTRHPRLVLLFLLSVLACGAGAQPAAKPAVLDQKTEWAVTYFHGLPDCECGPDDPLPFDPELERIAREVARIYYPREIQSKKLLWSRDVYGFEGASDAVAYYGIKRPTIVMSVASKGRVVRWAKLVPNPNEDPIALAMRLRAEMAKLFLRPASPKK